MPKPCPCRMAIALTGGPMHTTLERAYLAALAHHSRARVDHAAACLPFLVDPHFRKQEAGMQAQSPIPPSGTPTNSLTG